MFKEKYLTSTHNPHHLPSAPYISKGPSTSPKNNTRSKSRHIEHGDLGLLETIEGVQFIHIRALQPVSKEGEKVYKEETLLKAESKQLVFSLSAK